MADVLELTVEKAVAGGRMLARVDGRVVLVAGAIPGERVRARVERRVKQTVFATVVDVLEASPHRRKAFCDPRCGGLAYVHVDVAHQPVLKADVIADAFRRIAGVTVPPPIVWPSPEEGYRLRARLHVDGQGAGFYLEGTHTRCDAAATRQVREPVLDAVAALLDALGPARGLCETVTIAENVAGSERACHLEPRSNTAFGRMELPLPAGLTGVTVPAGRGTHAAAGRARITETAAALFRRASPVTEATTWVRSPASFFQGNRFLTGDLVACVASHARGARAIDAYAGVGLFAVVLAASGMTVTAIEGDPISAADLAINARGLPAPFRVFERSVEDGLASLEAGCADTLVIDPPRTGLSPRALAAAVGLRPGRIVYVSCDPATLARDAKGLAADGYGLTSLTGFDLFPNTAHVEAVAVFDR